MDFKISIDVYKDAVEKSVKKSNLNIKAFQIFIWGVMTTIKPL